MSNHECSIRKIIATYKADLPEQSLEYLESLLMAGEIGVAFEDLCTIMADNDVVCHAIHITELSEIGTAIGIGDGIVAQLSSR